MCSPSGDLWRQNTFEKVSATFAFTIRDFSEDVKRFVKIFSQRVFTGFSPGKVDSFFQCLLLFVKGTGGETI
jgi:hypothetical protein